MLARISPRFFPSLSLVALSALALGIAARPAAAQVTTYSTRTAFDMANPGLALETFEAAKVAPGALEYISAPLSASTNNSVFATGSIVPGLTLNTQILSSLVVSGTGTITGASKMVGNAGLGDTLSLSFAGGVTAAEFDLVASSAVGTSQATTVTITLFDTSNTKIGNAFTVNTATGLNFIGYSSTTSIGRIAVQSDGSHFVDNVAFGNPRTSSAIPEPGTFALAAAGLLPLAGMVARRRRRSA